MSFARHAAAVAVWTLPVAVFGSAGTARAEVGDALTISVLTFGPGDHPFTKFGHTAILVEDAEQRTRLVYNYGTFAFDTVWLIPNFLRGNYRYWLSIQSLDATLAAYSAAGRWVLAQRLHLTAAQKRSLVSSLEHDARPENKYYAYDYYGDNCVTRVRDVVDRVTEGALSRISRVPADLSLRQHTTALTADAPILRLLLNAALTSPTDRKIQAWDEMFLPAKLTQWLGRTRVQGTGTGDDPLVDAQRLLVPPRQASSSAVAADHADDPARFLETRAPKPWTPYTLSVGAIVGAFATTLGWLARKGRREARFLLGMALGTLGLVGGTLGCLFLFLWVGTRHAFAFHNQNLLQCPPFAVVLVLPAVRLAAGRGRHTGRWLYGASLFCLVGSISGGLIAPLPWFVQDNSEFIALWLPIWVGVTLSLAALTKKKVPRPLAPASASKGPADTAFHAT